MELVHLATMLDDAHRVPAFVGDQNAPVVLSCEDANTIIVAAALEAAWRTPLGVWLEVGDGYPASLAARDVATLSWLVALEHVVVHGGRARAHAQILEALLTNERVSITNEVASIRDAYNRPAPPRPVRVWYAEAESLFARDEELRALGTRNTPAGAATTYATA